MGVRSTAKYDFSERDEDAGEGGSPDPALNGSATKNGAVEHNGMMGRELELPVPQERRIPKPAATMANDLLTQPTPQSPMAEPPGGGHDLDAFLGKAFEE